eukprot:gene25000-31403_t
MVDKVKNWTFPPCEDDAYDLFTYLIWERPELFAHTKFALHADDDTFFRVDQVLRWLAALDNSGINTFPLIANGNFDDEKENVWHIKGCTEIHTNGWYQPMVLNHAALDRLKFGAKEYGLMQTCTNFDVTHDVGMGPYAWMFGFYHIHIPHITVQNSGGKGALPRDHLIIHALKHGKSEDDCNQASQWPEKDRYNQKMVIADGSPGDEIVADMYDAWDWQKTHGTQSQIELDSHQYEDHVVTSFKDHTKYVVAVKFSADGEYLATASHDKSVNVYHRNATSGDFEKTKTIQFLHTPEALLFALNSTPAATPSSGEDVDSSAVPVSTASLSKFELIIGLRGVGHLVYLDSDSFEQRLVSLNENEWDTHVSFTPLHLSTSPDGKLLLIATDKSLHFVVKIGTSHRVRTLAGHCCGDYGKPSVAWDCTGGYIFCNSDEDSAVFVYSLASERVVDRLSRAHKGIVRGVAELNCRHQLVNSYAGTPQYMAPEMLNGGHYNEKSDIWSLGCVIYELTTFKRPFECEGTVALAMKIDAGRYRRIPKLYSDDLSDAIRRRTLEAFYTDTDAWKGQVISQARQSLFQAVDGLARV